MELIAYNKVEKVGVVGPVEVHDVPCEKSTYSRAFILKVTAVIFVCAAVVVLGVGFGTGAFQSLLKKPYHVKAHISAMKNLNHGVGRKLNTEVVTPSSLSPSLTSSAYSVVDNLELLVGGVIFRSAHENGQVDFPMTPFPVSFGVHGDEAAISFPTEISVPGGTSASYTVSMYS